MLLESRERLVDAKLESNNLQEESTELSSNNIVLEEKLRKTEAFISEYCATTTKTFDLVEDAVRPKFQNSIDRRDEIARFHGMKISHGKVSMLAEYDGKRIGQRTLLGGRWWQGTEEGHACQGQRPGEVRRQSQRSQNCTQRTYGWTLKDRLKNQHFMATVTSMKAYD